MNGSASCQMQLGRFEDAEKDLLEALSKDAKVYHFMSYGSELTIDYCCFTSCAWFYASSDC